MRLALNLGYLGRGSLSATRQLAAMTALACEADHLGLSSAWVGEAQGSDAPSLLAWIAAHTSSMGLGASVLQVPARSPAATAMTAASLDVLSGGRLQLGLGTSGGQLSEGWHGVRFGDPLTRLREYVDIVRMALAGESVRYAGRHHVLPLPGGPGKPLRLGIRPIRSRIPIYLAALGPRSLELAGEIGDGWLALFLDPACSAEQFGRIAAGRLKGAGERPDFDVVATVPLVVGDVVAACSEPVREFAAIYLGGMGSREQNFYNKIAQRMGYPEAAHAIQEHFLQRRPLAAARSVPLEFIDRTSLLGPVSRIVRRLHEYAAAGVTTVSLMPMARDNEANIHALRSVHAAFFASLEPVPASKHASERSG